MSYGDRSAKSQMKQAGASGARYAILIGANELTGGFVTVKDLQAAGMEQEEKQVQAKRDELIALLTT